MKIRQLKLKDLRVAQQIFFTAFGWDESLLALEDVRTAIENPIEGGYKFVDVFGAENSVGLVGVCGIYQLIQSPDGIWPATPPDFCGINWFAVDQSQQHRGIGSALLSEAESRACKQFKTMFVYADKKAEPFYLKRGYSLATERFPDCPDVNGTLLLFKKLK